MRKFRRCSKKGSIVIKGKKIEDFTGFTLSDEEIEEIVQGECKKFSKDQKYLRALYTGGTLADEAMKMLGKEGYRIYSNIPLSPELRLENVILVGSIHALIWVTMILLLENHIL